MDKIERAMIIKGLTEDQKIIFDLAIKLSENPETMNQANLLMVCLLGMKYSPICVSILEITEPIVTMMEIITAIAENDIAKDN